MPNVEITSKDIEHLSFIPNYLSSWILLRISTESSTTRCRKANILNSTQYWPNIQMKQGDYEMESGRLPLPIMNRFHQDEKALHQVGSLFFSLHVYLVVVINQQISPRLFTCFCVNFYVLNKDLVEKKKGIDLSG